MTQVKLEDAKTRLSDLVTAALQGEDVVITQDDQPLVKLTPVGPAKPRRRAGSAKGLIQMAEDFDAPLEDFKEHMQ